MQLFALSVECTAVKVNQFGTVDTVFACVRARTSIYRTRPTRGVEPWSILGSRRGLSPYALRTRPHAGSAGIECMSGKMKAGIPSFHHSQ